MCACIFFVSNHVFFKESKVCGKIVNFAGLQFLWRKSLTYAKSQIYYIKLQFHDIKLLILHFSVRNYFSVEAKFLVVKTVLIFFSF